METACLFILTLNLAALILYCGIGMINRDIANGFIQAVLQDGWIGKISLFVFLPFLLAKLVVLVLFIEDIPTMLAVFLGMGGNDEDEDEDNNGEE